MTEKHKRITPKKTPPDTPKGIRAIPSEKSTVKSAMCSFIVKMFGNEIVISNVRFGSAADARQFITWVAAYGQKQPLKVEVFIGLSTSQRMRHLSRLPMAAQFLLRGKTCL